MDGIAGVTARIAEIQARMATLAPTPRPAGAASSSTTFASALATAVTEQGAAPAVTGSSAMAPATAGGKLNADGVPVELAAYGNGKIPASALQEIGRGNHRLWAPAADSFTKLTEAAARDGVKIGVTDSYRSYEAQVDVARRKGLYSQGGLAAKPGTSDHGWGRSVDLDLSASALTWMRANASRFGFSEDVPRESWHWTYTP